MKKILGVGFSAALITLFLIACGEKTPEAPTETTAPTESAQPSVPVDTSTVGTISGKVLFQGTKPKLRALMMDQDPVCVGKHKGPVFPEDSEVNANGTLPNVFVYVKSGAEKYQFPAPTEAATLDQNGCMYKPHVLGLRVGQTLHIVSSDPTTHNIHPMPKDNREWNMSQAPGAAPIEQKFVRPEIMIPVKCNQHPWMRAYIGVLKSPLFAVSGTDGTFAIKGIPPGEYTVEAWSAGFGSGEMRQEQKVTVGPRESKKVEFTFKAS